MKKYVMFCFSDEVGGGQNYVDTKVRWLKENGWEVIVFGAVTAISKNKSILWNNLKEFESYRRIDFNTFPEFWSADRVEKTLSWMEDCVGSNYDDVIIESHTDFFADWGERLAKRIGAKHICYLLDERLWLYQAKEFLYYKYLRNEVAGIDSTSMKKLFYGYKDVPESERWVLKASHSGGVADIANEDIKRLNRMDYNIAYIGRNKQYVLNVIEGVKKFAEKHIEKTVHFIVLGEIGSNNQFGLPSNVYVTYLGFLTPIPRSFFLHVDVVIAGAGCATISARENVPTIVADAKTCLASGVLGYTVQNTVFSDNKPEKFEDMLEDVLMYKTYKQYEYIPREKIDLNASFEKHFDFIRSSCTKKEYFDFQAHPQVVFSCKQRAKFYISLVLKKYVPCIIPIILQAKNRVKQFKR